MTLVKFNPQTNSSLLPGLNDVLDSIFDYTYFSDRMVNRVATGPAVINEKFFPQGGTLTCCPYPRVV